VKILIIGSGGREHCLVWKIAQSKSVTKIYCAPGNGGTAQIAENINISETDIDKLLNFALDNKIDLTIVGPEAPLVRGIVDKFRDAGLKIFGPTKELAQLEGSKSFAKELMQKYNVPSAGYKVFTDSREAREHVKSCKLPVVIKADGLAAGKGVIICATVNEALGALDLIMEERIFGKAGDKIVIEECLVGEEVSLLAITDGRNILPLVASQDHKRAKDGDSGPNTGGMGAYAPVPFVDEGIMTRIVNKVFWPLLDGLRKEGRPYRGLLYAGLMIKDKEPSVLEFNVRFGDPETQAILPKLKSDLVDVMLKSLQDNGLAGEKLEWDERFCLCVVAAAGGYPGNYEKNKAITGLEKVEGTEDVYFFHAGTKVAPKEKIEETPEEAYVRNLKGDSFQKIVTTGGRVFNVVSLGLTIEEAQSKAYNAIKNVNFDGMFYRHDIGRKAMKIT